MASTTDVRRGSIVWVEPDPTVGREQSGRRPMVVVASAEYLHVMRDLALAVPVTSADRGWPNHVPLGGSSGVRGFAMTEQIRAIDRRCIVKGAGVADAEAMSQIDTWLRDFLALGAGRSS